MTVSRAVKLFGTEEAVEEAIILTAGPLEVSLDAGNLRYVRVAGVEAMRGIAFLVRDSNWRTYGPTITDLVIDQTGEGFTVRYEAECRDDAQAFRYTAHIEGRADGTLTFSAEGEALTDFVTNRNGFVVLHPLAGVVGAPVTVEHTDGRVEERSFPDLIDPSCPHQDIRALTHDVMPGVKVVCRMEGDAFEMEDHRNWMDASYKTYVRPLALPWPYTMAQGERLSQSVTLTLDGEIRAGDDAGAVEPIKITVGDTTGRMAPRIGLAAAPEGLREAAEHADLLMASGPSFLVCHFDPSKGHDEEAMRGFAQLGEATGAGLVLEAVVPCVDANGEPSDDRDIMRRDIAAIAAAATAAEVQFERVAVSPATDLGCTLPGTEFPKAPGWGELMAAAREAFPGVPVGGGMFSYFTELNRKRPPADLLDFICHSGCSIVHAGDDISLTETLESTPSIFKSVRGFAGDKPYWIFPTAISMRLNPYGDAPAENPDNIRQAMNRVDPRERGLIGAAWYAGYLARSAAAGVEAVTLAAVAGPSGIVSMTQPHARPGFDDTDAAVHPHYHVIAGHAGLNGEVLATTSSDARTIQALAVAEADRTTLWITNLTGTSQSIDITGIGTGGRGLILDEESFEDACIDPDWRSTAARTSMGAEPLVLRAYAVAEIWFNK